MSVNARGPYLFYVVAQFPKGNATMSPDPDFPTQNLFDAILRAEALERDIAEREAEARKRWRKLWRRFIMALAFAVMLMACLTIGYFLGGLR
jgi:hypothetical protein